jgi:hypothetical protein
MRILVTAVLLASLSTVSCTSGTHPAHQDKNPLDNLAKSSIRMTLPGVWDWTTEPETCQRDNVHTIWFSDDGRSLFFHHPQGAELEDGVLQQVIEYSVLEELPTGLRLQAKREGRRDEMGNLVTWELRLLSTSSYCWHRSDWREQGCTSPIVRCPDRLPNHGLG